MMDGTDEILKYPYSAYECPITMTGWMRKAADSALNVGHRHRARVLLQIGNMFKLQAMSKWWTSISQDYPDKGKDLQGNLPPKKKQRFEPRMQMDYSIGLSILTEQLQAQPRHIVKFQSHDISNVASYMGESNQ